MEVNLLLLKDLLTIKNKIHDFNTKKCVQYNNTYHKTIKMKPVYVKHIY